MANRKDNAVAAKKIPRSPTKTVGKELGGFFPWFTGGCSVSRRGQRNAAPRREVKREQKQLFTAEDLRQLEYTGAYAR